MLATGLLAPLHAQSGVLAAFLPSNSALLLQTNYSRAEYERDP